MLNAEERNYIFDKCRKEELLPAELKLVSYLGLKAIDRKYGDKIYKIAFIRNYSEAVKYSYEKKTRLGFQDNSKGYERSNWMELSFEQLVEFIESSINNEEVFASIIINSTRYNNAILYKTVAGNTAVRYEYSNKE